MKNQATLKWLIPLIGLLSLLAAGAGLFYQLPGEPYPYTNHRGESVMINGQGLYYYNTVSMAEGLELMIPFLIITLLNLIMVVLLLKNVKTDLQDKSLSAQLTSHQR